MRKILIVGILTIALIATIGLVSAGYGSSDGYGPEFIDEDGNDICDNFVDEDGDGINDNCGGTGLGVHNRYRNGGGGYGTGYGPGNCRDN